MRRLNQHVKLNMALIMLVALICDLGIAAQDMSVYPLSVDSPSVESAANFLLTCQNEDGGFGSNPGAESELVPTCQAITAMVALKKDISSLKYGNPLKYLLANQDLLANLSNAEAQTGRFVVTLAAAGVDPHNVSGRNYVDILKSYSKSSGEIGKDNYIWDDPWVIMGLVASNESRCEQIAKAMEYLRSVQTQSGGWSWNGGPDGQDADTTGIVICALMAAGENNTSEPIQNALHYLKSEQNADGGFSSMGSNAATDGWAILAINAVDQNPCEWRIGLADPVSHLLSLQSKDGSFWWKKDSQGMAYEWTANGIVALIGDKMPPINFKFL